MLIKSQHLNPKLFLDSIEYLPNRKGFGEGLVEAGRDNSNVVALSADLVGSTLMSIFAKEFPERFIEIGVAEQNLVTIGSGLAAVGKIPFVSSYAAFSPGRNWEQIRTTICLNEQPVKIVGSHAGVSVGPDGATHQMLEDIALMRVLPNMTVVVPCDAVEAHKATVALAKTKTPAYIRLAREKTPLVTTKETPFKIGQANVIQEGRDVSVIVCGPLLYEALLAARELEADGHTVEIINCATVKPLDKITILKSVEKTGAVVTVEEAQVAGGLGGAIAEMLAFHHPVPIGFIGIKDRFGQSGTVSELWDEYGLSSPQIAQTIIQTIKRKAL